MHAAREIQKADQRAQFLEAALRMLEESGPDALQARALAAEVGVSTQAVYTLFGGMPGLFRALVADGFARFADYVDAVPRTDDPVADFFAQGAAYGEWALSHPRLYRLMFELAGGSLTSFQEGEAALDVMVQALDRVKQSGRIRQEDTVHIAGQFLSATHGYLLLEIAGAFGRQGEGLQVASGFAVNLMVGLGDSREAAERSLRAGLEARTRR